MADRVDTGADQNCEPGSPEAMPTAPTAIESTSVASSTVSEARIGDLPRYREKIIAVIRANPGKKAKEFVPAAFHPLQHWKAGHRVQCAGRSDSGLGSRAARSDSRYHRGLIGTVRVLLEARTGHHGGYRATDGPHIARGCTRRRRLDRSAVVQLGVRLR